MGISGIADDRKGAGVLLPAGEYAVKIIDAQDTWSKAGNAMIELTLAIKGAAEIGRTWEYLSGSESGLWKVEEFLRAIGHYPGKGQPFDLKAPALVGLKARAVVGVEEWNGKEKNKIAKWIAAPAQTPFPVPATAPPPAPRYDNSPPPPAAPPDSGVDDLPF